MDDVERQAALEAQEQLLDDTWSDVVEMTGDPDRVWDALADVLAEDTRLRRRVVRLVMRAMQSDSALRLPVQKQLARQAFDERTRELANRQALKALLEHHLKRAVI